MTGATRLDLGLMASLAAAANVPGVDLWGSILAAEEEKIGGCVVEPLRDHLMSGVRRFTAARNGWHCPEKLMVLIASIKSEALNVANRVLS